MAMTQYDNGGGGSIPGTAGSICTISPKDTETVIGNLLSRIEKLEFNLSQVLGANLHANTLGDLSSQVGWVYGVDYMGVPGWIRTEAGSLIPPPGFTLSQHGFQMLNTCTGEYEDYHGVSTDSDGVIQFGFQANGEVSGCKPQSWDAAAAAVGVDPDYIIVSGATTVGSRGITVNTNNLTSTSGGAVNVTVSNAGLYHVDIQAYMNRPTETASGVAIYLLSGVNVNSVDSGIDDIGNTGQRNVANGDNWHSPWVASHSHGMLSLGAGDVVEGGFSPSSGSGFSHLKAARFSLIRLGNA